MRPLNKFVSAEESILEFTGVNFNGDNILPSGKALYLHDICNFVDVLITELKRHIQSDLFFGIDVVDINWSPDIYEGLYWTQTFACRSVNLFGE
jgi:hypothetical protein